jgi:hypothetical protein
MKTSPNEGQPPVKDKKLQVPAPVQPAASRDHPSPSRVLAPALGVSTETEISSNEASPAELAAYQAKKSLIEAASLAVATAPETKISPNKVQPPVREKKLQMLTPAPARLAISSNHPSSGGSMTSARENTVGTITGRLDPAPREERRLPLLRSVGSSLAVLTGDEYYYKIIRAYLFTFLISSFWIIPMLRASP